MRKENGYPFCDLFFDKSDILYEIVGKQIVLQKIQTKTSRIVSGVVKDEQGEAVIGASVLVKGTTNGTVTDFNGKFELQNIPENATIDVLSLIHI